MSKPNDNYIKKDFKKKFVINDETKNHIANFPTNYFDSSIRIQLGMFRTDIEYEKYITESLNRPLP